MSTKQRNAKDALTLKARESGLGSLLPILGAVAVAVSVTPGCGGRAETEATQQLKDMGALPVLKDGHTDSLAVGLPGVQDRLDEALPLVPKLSYLQTFNANATDISDAHLAHIGSVRSLINLLVSDTPVGDDGVQELAGLSKLESLYLANTQITSASIPTLAKLKALKVLDISGTKISGGLEPLVDLEELGVLSVNDLELSDADVDVLIQIPKLQLLYVSGTQISEQGVEKLRANISKLNFGDQ